MSLTTALLDVLAEFVRRHPEAPGVRLAIQAQDPWDLHLTLSLPGTSELTVRALRQGDVPALQQFSSRLGPASKELFCPYPWSKPEELPAALQRAIDHSLGRSDAAYVMEAEHTVVGHFFLWKAGGNPLSQAHGIQVPELGVAIADDWHSRGLGHLAVRILQEVARELHADAIELTTAMTNSAGWNTYRRCGFEHVGTLSIPLEVDVTAAELGEVKATKFRDERQMVYVLHEEQEPQVLAYLEGKRAAAGSK